MSSWTESPLTKARAARAAPRDCPVNHPNGLFQLGDRAAETLEAEEVLVVGLQMPPMATSGCSG
jgi:hypothetical protein